MSSSSPSPTSDETPSERERQRLRNFVNEVTAVDRQASMSPRSAVLSHSSLHTRPHSSQAVDPSSAVVDPRAQPRKRSKRRQGHHQPQHPSQALELARPSVLSQLIDVDISRKNPIDEVMRLRQILKTVEKHAVLETQRATDLQRANREAQLQVHHLNETKLIAEQEAAKAQQEKRLAELQLDSAQKEIERSQEAVKRAERQRQEAEADAARARAKTRKLHEQQLMVAAREEGRRLGFEAGFEHARAERQAVQAAKAARRKANPPKPAPVPQAAPTPAPATAIVPELKPVPIEYNISNHSRSRVDKGKGKERAYVDDDDGEITPYRSNVHHPRYPPSRQSMSRRERDDIVSSPDGPDMSPSELKIKNLPLDIDSRPPSMRAGPSNASPLRPFRAPTASHSETSERTAPPTNFQPFPQPQVSQPQPPIEIAQPVPQTPQQQSPRPPSHAPPPIRTPTPEMDRWSLNVPNQSQLNVNMPILATRLPRDQWVSAEKHLKAPSPPPQFPGGPPPMHIPPPQPQHKSTPTKPTKFHLLSRPSLLKTKQQATSWYRSLSIRKKNKPVIDPEEPPTTASTSALTSGPISAPLNTSSTFDSQPQSATDPPTAPVIPDSAGMYGRPPSQPVTSWYQAKQPSVPAPSTVRSQYSRHRPSSDMMSVSTRVSQFDLLSTPYIASQSVKSGKEGNKRVKEKESYMSVIKENPFSRENTPNVDRYLPPGSMPGDENGPSGSFSITQPDFGKQPSLDQRPSYATFESSTKQNSRRPPPPSITVPAHDAELGPIGAAYAAYDRAMKRENPDSHLLSKRSGDQIYPGADLNRRPSERTTPGTAIGIDVVPPSGFAPDIPNSPPHTGINHLSPYRTYGSASQTSPRVAAVQSVTSLRTEGGTRAGPERPGSVSDPRRKSRQSINTYTDPALQSYPQRPPSSTSRAPSRSINEYNYQDPSYTMPHGRPESVRSSASKPLPHPTSTMNQAIDTQDRNAPGGQYLNRPNIQRMKSSTSLRSVGSYSKYKANEYVDPAFWSADGPGELMHQNGGDGGSFYHQERPRSRTGSISSDLSYV